MKCNIFGNHCGIGVLRHTDHKHAKHTHKILLVIAHQRAPDHLVSPIAGANGWNLVDFTADSKPIDHALGGTIATVIAVVIRNINTGSVAKMQLTAAAINDIKE